MFIISLFAVFLLSCRDVSSPIQRVEAVLPEITKDNLIDQTYGVGAEADAYYVQAGGNGAGTLYYQWFKAKSKESGPEWAIEGAKEAHYTPSTEEISTFYYYVTITNEIENNGDGGAKKAVIASKKVKVSVVNNASPIIKWPDGVTEFNYTAGEEAPQPLRPIIIIGSVGETGPKLQWEAAESANGPWVIIDGAEAAYYTPVYTEESVIWYRIVVTNIVNFEIFKTESVPVKVKFAVEGSSPAPSPPGGEEGAPPGNPSEPEGGGDEDEGSTVSPPEAPSTTEVGGDGGATPDQSATEGDDGVSTPGGVVSEPDETGAEGQGV
ncbi:MAG: hypothetical protein LBC53_02105 [Spirochaetaceae bacterium]|jgi:hypothetical protein|nr:hypothetical protein [Spirochaetaceae bacterium]